MARQMTPARAARIRQKFRHLEDTVKVVFWDVEWVLWRRTRPIGSWDAGTAGEGWELIGSGTGRLRENGRGGPVSGDGPIYQQAPYRLRVNVDAFDAFRAPSEDGRSEHETSAAWMVIDGRRLFKVMSFAPRGGERQHANAYLAEMFDVELPAGVP
jgi:hypothetical protein